MLDECFSYRNSFPFDFHYAVSKNNNIILFFFFFLTEKRIRIRIQKEDRNDEFTLLIYSFFPIYTIFLTILLKILLILYTLHYPKILFYKIYFKIIAINLLKKIHPSSFPKIHPSSFPSQMLETFHSIMWIIESNELIQLRWYHSSPSRGFKHDDARVKRAFPHLCADNRARIKRRNNSNPYQSGNALNSSHNSCISINRPLNNGWKTTWGLNYQKWDYGNYREGFS